MEATQPTRSLEVRGRSCLTSALWARCRGKDQGSGSAIKLGEVIGWHCEGWRGTQVPLMLVGQKAAETSLGSAPTS